MNPGPDPLAARVVARLRDLGDTLSTSESLTGGLVAAAITSVPGASEAFLGGVVAYATPLKARLSGVPAPLLEEHGAISEQAVAEMAAGIGSVTGTDWAVATSGVAGPAEQEGHPPGTVWVAVWGPGVATAALHRFEGDRASVRSQAVEAALSLLLVNLPPGETSARP
ncbi:MAG: CinA family protein [Propionicimonas sp.]|nr:CinA family protein [Propionicimonas sp.]